MKPFIHPTSIIDENVYIGKNSKIWHFSHILHNSEIKDNVNIGQNCMIGPNVRIAQGCKIQNNVSLYEGVECQEDVFIGPSVVFTNVYNPRAFINRKNEFRKTLLKKGCSIGANATIICGINIGKYAFIGAGSLIREDVLDFALMVGVPARQIGWIDKGGEKMIFDSNAKAIDSYDKTKYYLKNGRVLIDEN